MTALLAVTGVTRAHVLHGSPEDAVAAVAAAVMAASALRLRRLRSTAEADDRVRWLRAAVYTGGCVLLAWITGALSATLRGPWVAGGHGAGAVALIAGAVAVALAGYWVVWPRGTWTHGRPRADVQQTLFGLAWGAGEGLLIAAGCAAAEWAGIAEPVAAVVAWVLLSAWIGGFHALYWDLRVTPDHNDPAWNARKVLLVHVPNLTLAVALIAGLGAVPVVVLLQAVALVGAARAMRFPPWPRRGRHRPGDPASPPSTTALGDPA